MTNRIVFIIALSFSFIFGVDPPKEVETSSQTGPGQQLLLVLRHAGDVPHAGRLLEAVGQCVQPDVVEDAAQRGSPGGYLGFERQLGEIRRPHLFDVAPRADAGSLLEASAALSSDHRVTGRAKFSVIPEAAAVSRIDRVTDFALSPTAD